MKEYLETQAETEIVKQQGLALAEARAKAEALIIEGESKITEAQNKVKAQEIKNSAELELVKQRNETELAHMQALDELEIQS